MRSHLPLDDQLNHVFYVDGALFRLVYNRAWERCVLRRELRRIAFDLAVALIAHGDVLWVPPEEFQRLTASTPCDTVRREQALLCAFLLSPAARRITDAEMRARLVARLNDDEMWLGRGALPR